MPFETPFVSYLGLYDSTFWTVEEKTDFALLEHRKVDKVSKGISFLVHAFQKIWDSKAAPYRIIILSEKKGYTVARACDKNEAYFLWNEIIKLREIFKEKRVEGQELCHAMLECIRIRVDGGNDKFKVDDVLEQKLHFVAMKREQEEKIEIVKLDDIWKSFFEQSFVHGKKAIEKNWISIEDCQDNEPFLYLGLPALTFFEALNRSLIHGKKGIELAGGQVVYEDSLPEEKKELYKGLFNLKQELEEKNYSEEEKDLVRQILLFNSDPYKPTVTISDEKRSVDIMRFVSKVNSLATRVSQMSFYLEEFNNVLIKLGSLQ